MESNMFLLVTDVIWELAKKIPERQVKIIAPYAIIKMAMRMIMMTVKNNDEDETRLGDLIVFSICLAVSLACRREIARD